MRFVATDGSTVHLSYCSNVHPAEDAEGVIAQLGRFTGPVRTRLGWPVLGLGLWLSSAAALQLEQDPELFEQLSSELAANHLEVVTFNGFPYGGFHDPVVKHAVYHPDWTTDERAQHTVRLAGLLARLLPADVSVGTISTLPLGFRDPWDVDRTEAGVRQLRLVDEALSRLESETGKRIVVALEPEPGCVLETTRHVADLLSGRGLSRIQACLDAAHLAVQFEDPGQAIPALAQRVGIAKAQLSVALQTADPRGDRAFLREHDEPRFLHQVRESGAGGVLGTDDLPEALAGGLPCHDGWRVHVHLPLHVDSTWTTAGELKDCLALLVGGAAPLTRSLEVETYTWSVLPSALRPTDDDGLVAGIAAELAWVRDELEALGLKEMPV